MDGRREISPSAFSKPSPWGPTPLVKGRWPKARGDRVRWPRRGRMRGQVSDCICCTQGSFAACGRRVPSDGKETKGSPGDGSGWTLRVHIRLPYPLCRFATAPPDRGSRPPDPRYGGYPLKWAEHFRRAKSGVLGCGPVRATGPWVGGKLGLMRFRICAWPCRTNAPRPLSAVGAASCGRP